MKYVIDHFTYAQLTWLIVISYAFHYLEEGPRLAKWLNEHYPVIQKKGMFYTQAKLNTENLIMFSATLLTVVLINYYPDNWMLRAINLGWAVGLFGNTYFHAKPTILQAIYSPGVVTSAFFFPVTLIILIEKALLENFFSLPLAIFSIIWGPLGYIGMITFTHKVLFKNTLR